MAVISSKTLSVVREPSIDDVILGDGEDKITLSVELDLGERTLVTREKDGTLEWKEADRM